MVFIVVGVSVRRVRYGRTAVTGSSTGLVDRWTGLNEPPVLLLMLNFMGSWRVPRVLAGDIIPEIQGECMSRAVLVRVGSIWLKIKIKLKLRLTQNRVSFKVRMAVRN